MMYQLFSLTPLTALMISLLILSPARAAGLDDDDTAGAGDTPVMASEILTARAALKNNDYPLAITTLKPLADSDNVEALNLLGYSHRQLKHFDQAFIYYQRALALDPAHLGANEYLGELYLKMKRLPLARRQLDILSELCQDCEAYRTLQKAIAQYTAD